MRERLLLQDAQCNIWKGLLDEKQVEDLMRRDNIKFSERIEDTHSEPLKVTLESGIVGLFKSEKPSEKEPFRSMYYKSEIAAFRIAKIAGWEIIALTV